MIDYQFNIIPLQNGYELSFIDFPDFHFTLNDLYNLNQDVLYSLNYIKEIYSSRGLSLPEPTLISPVKCYSSLENKIFEIIKAIEMTEYYSVHDIKENDFIYQDIQKQNFISREKTLNLLKQCL